MIGSVAGVCFARRKVGDFQQQRVKHGDAARRVLVQVVAHGLFQHVHVKPRIGLGDTGALGKQAKTASGKTAPARARDGGQTRVVPAVDVPFADQTDEFALGEHGLIEIEPRKLNLLR